MTRAELQSPTDLKTNAIRDVPAALRALLADVFALFLKTTLVLTVALVVMVIFLFLRNFWATIIPAVTVPLSLVGTADPKHA